MDGELDRLRNVVRALVAERHADSLAMEILREWHKCGEPPPMDPPPPEFFRLNEVHKDCERVLKQALARLTEIESRPLDHVDDELDRLRSVVRAFAAERQSWSAFHEFMHERRGKPPTEESIA